MPKKAKAKVGRPKKAATMIAHLFISACMNYERSFEGTSEKDVIKQVQDYIAEYDNDDFNNYVLLWGKNSILFAPPNRTTWTASKEYPLTALEEVEVYRP